MDNFLVLDEKDFAKMSKDDIHARINQLRRNVLIHSIIYYRFNDNIIEDYEYTAMANELYKLQKLYPDIAKTCVYAEEYKDFDPCTGHNLPLEDPWAVNKALYLLRLYGREIRD